MTLDPFRRAALLALAWCLVGLGIDTGAGPRSRRGPARPADHFASARTSAAESERSNTVTRPISPR